jgi:hypothetical protein
MRYAKRVTVAAALTFLVAGCASSPPPDSPQSVPSPSVPPLGATPTTAATASPSPTRAGSRPADPLPTSNLTAKPPNGPSDQIKPSKFIIGTVTAGGSGPCYGLETDEGVQFALHSTSGLELTRGSRVRVQTEPARAKIYCGPGRPLELVTAEPVR